MPTVTSNISRKIGRTSFAVQTIFEKGSNELTDEHWEEIAEKYKTGLKPLLESKAIIVTTTVVAESDIINIIPDDAPRDAIPPPASADTVGLATVAPAPEEKHGHLGRRAIRRLADLDPDTLLGMISRGELHGPQIMLAVEIAGGIKSLSATDVAITISSATLGSEHIYIREAVVHGLASLGDPCVIPLLAAIAAEDPSPDVQAEARDALDELAVPTTLTLTPRDETSAPPEKDITRSLLEISIPKARPIIAAETDIDTLSVWLEDERSGIRSLVEDRLEELTRPEDSD